MNFSIINPSDPYTFRAATFEAAVLACLLIDPSGACPCEVLDDDFEPTPERERMPFAMLEDFSGWYVSRFDRDPADGMLALRPEVADALESVVIGRAIDRRRMERVLAVIRDPEDRERVRETWHDARRSSMNDIGGRAKKIAAKLRKGDPEGAVRQARESASPVVFGG